MGSKRVAAQRWSAIAAFVAFATCASPARAQQPTLNDGLLDRLIGRWVLTGVIAQKPTTHDVEAEWVLNHQFVRIHEVSRERVERTDAPQYEAIVLIGWDEQRGRYVVHWTDVYGGGFSLVGHAPRAAGSQSLAFVFDDAADKFYTTFAYDPSDTWSVTMDNERAGERRAFARLSMSRAK